MNLSIAFIQISIWALVLKNLFNSLVVVHSSLGQRLIRHEWEAFLPDVGLNKSLGFKGKPPPSPFRLPMRSYVKECTTTTWGGSFWDLLYFACVLVVRSSLGQRLIRHEWEASLSDVGLNKSLRTKVQCISKEDNTWLGAETKVLPQYQFKPFNWTKKNQILISNPKK